MKHREVFTIVIVAFFIGCGLGYIYADDQRIERESGVRVVSK